MKMHGAGELEGKRSGAAGVNDVPGARQSRGVTEPQREKARLEYNNPSSEKAWQTFLTS